MKKKNFVIFVFGMPIDVEHVDDLATTDEASGIFCEREWTIKLDSSLEGESYVATLVHEIGHAVMVRAGGRQAIHSQAEEMLVDQLGVAISENFNLSLRKK